MDNSFNYFKKNEGPWCTISDMVHPRPLSPLFHVLEPSPYAIFFLSFVFPFLCHVLSFSSSQIHLSLSLSLSQSPLSLTPMSHHLRLPLSATHHQLHLSLPHDLSLSLSLSLSSLPSSALLLSWWLGADFNLPKQAIVLGELLTLNLLASFVPFFFILRRK